MGEAIELLDSLRHEVVAFAVTSVGTVASVMQPVQTLPGNLNIFLNNRGHPYCREVLAQQLRRLKRKLGIQSSATLHGIRHRFATAAIGNGASVKLIAEQLGHSSTMVTERYYWSRSAEHTGSIREAIMRGMPKGQGGVYSGK